MVSSSHRVSASGHAHTEGLVEVAASLIQGALLLFQIACLLKLLPLGPPPPPHAAENSTCASADGGAFSCVTADGAPNCSQGCSPGGSPEQSALRCTHGGRRAARNSRIRGIEAALLNGPGVALAAIGLLLLRTLAPAWIGIYLAFSTRGRYFATTQAGAFSATIHLRSFKVVPWYDKTQRSCPNARICN